ncbi:Uncharacterised protein [Providencia rettgeri]|uniref:Uncharacterized protein n=1 Tax=Providencia rettgeri TaxID=587 RepID=A0A9N8H1K3_PRORE|nr:Uncharacterised protein [Providencia rettgeri]CAB5718592.1 Uncharacterised protein [Providencia rettgeri]CAC9263760.1 Uncharacterised protein [Providencia rettgeri]CAC9292227.1 Uncharacterised protein [Providencia rettgeri]
MKKPDYHIIDPLIEPLVKAFITEFGSHSSMK